jgi:hypothetical protein
MLSVTDDPLQPPGNVQLYDSAPLTAATEKVLVLPLHTPTGPMIDPGVEGAVLKTLTATLPVMLNVEQYPDVTTV